MTQNHQSPDELYRDLRVDLEEQKFYKLLSKLLPFSLALVVIIILTTIIYVWNDNSKEHAAKADSLLYYNNYADILKDGDTKLTASFKTEDLQTFTSSIYAAMAKIKYTNALVGQKKYKEAVKLLEDVASDSNNSSWIRELATLLRINIDYSYNNQNIAKEITPLTNTNSAWFAQAKLLEAANYIKFGDEKQAKKSLQDLLSSDKLSPQQTLLIKQIDSTLSK